MNKKLSLILLATSVLFSSLLASPQSQTNKNTASKAQTSAPNSKGSSSNTASASSLSTESSSTSTQTSMENQIHEEEETNIVSNTSTNATKTPATSTNTTSATTTKNTNNSSNTAKTTDSTDTTTSTETTSSSQTSSSTSTTNTSSNQESLSLDTARISATFGYRIATNLMADPGFSFDLDSFIIGMRQAIDGKQAPMSDEEFMEAISKIQEKALQELGESNLSEANQFMENNKKNAAVIEVSENTLQYEVIQEGKGEEVGESSQPVIHFTGKYLDGMVFASSMDNESPITLPSDQSFSFRKGLTGAKEGEKRRVYLHPSLGAGTSGFHPPHSLLVFDVTIIKANSTEGSSSSEEISARMGIDTGSEAIATQSTTTQSTR